MIPNISEDMPLKLGYRSFPLIAFENINDYNQKIMQIFCAYISLPTAFMVTSMN